MSDQKPTPTFRFAPSPNGALHLGHAYSALLNHVLAKRAGVDLIIRVEDIDLIRCTPELEATMFDDLAWLGIEWQTPVMRQSERFSLYQKALDQLHEKGLIYPSFMTRGDIKKHASTTSNWPRDPDGAPLYPGLEKDWSAQKCADAIALGRPFAWRLDMEKALSLAPIKGAKDWGDVILARKDIPTSYYLAVVVDDHAQDITHVVRGLDLEEATSVHLMLQNLLGLPSPAYFHHRLIKNESGEKLSKSNRATSLQHLREQGASVADILKLIEWDEAEVDQIYGSFVTQCT